MCFPSASVLWVMVRDNIKIYDIDDIAIKLSTEAISWLKILSGISVGPAGLPRQSDYL